MLVAAEGDKRFLRQMLDQEALAWAALNNHLNIVELMLEKGADDYYVS